MAPVNRRNSPRSPAVLRGPAEGGLQRFFDPALHAVNLGLVPEGIGTKFLDELGQAGQRGRGDAAAKQAIVDGLGDFLVNGVRHGRVSGARESLPFVPRVTERDVLENYAAPVA